MSKCLKLLVAIILVMPFFVVAAKADTGTGTTFTVNKAAAPTTASPSSTIAYSITITNISVSNAAPEVVTDTMPDGFTYAGNAKLTEVGGNQVTFEPVPSGQILTWTFDGDTLQSIPQNQNIVISYQLTAPATTGQYTNQACLTSPESVCANETVTITTNPNTGILDNILIGLVIGGILIAIGLKLPHSKLSFEEKLLHKKNSTKL